MPDKRLAPSRLRGDGDLAARRRRSSRTARRAWPRSAATRAASRPAGPGADHDHDLAPSRPRLPDDMRHRRLAPGRRVLDAERVAAHVDAIDAIAGADALADVVGTPFGELLRTRCGSAMWARVIATMSTCPSATARAAVARSVTRWAWNTGMSTSRLIAARQEQERRHRKRHVRDRDRVRDVIACLAAQHVQESRRSRACAYSARDRQAILLRSDRRRSSRRPTCGCP